MLESLVLESPEVSRSLQALRAMRTPGWMYAAHFLGLAFDSLEGDTASVSMPIGPHCVDGQGNVAVAALSVLADVAFAAAVRGQAGAAVRLATLTARLSFAQRPSRGRLSGVSRNRFTLPSLSMPSAVTTLEISGDDGVCCIGEASFAVLDNRRGTTEHPMPRHSTVEGLAPLEVSELTDAERAVLDQAVAAQQAVKSSPSLGFLDAFWQLAPMTEESGARCRIDAGLHVSNRVGHIQGGILMAVAAKTCAAAAPPGWLLLDLSVQYVEAASGAWVQACATPLRVGRNSASIECRVQDPEGRTTLCAQAIFMRPA